MMRLIPKSILAIFLLGTLASGQTGGVSAGGSYEGPHSLGPYSVDKDLLLRTLLVALGAQPSSRETYCFADGENGLYLYTRPMHDGSSRVAEIFLSSFPNCKGQPVQATSIKPDVWKTFEGVKIGSTKEKILRTYGMPNLATKLDTKSDLGVIAGIKEAGASRVSVGDSSFLYNCSPSDKPACAVDNRATQMGFRNGQLIWIRISNSE